MYNNFTKLYNYITASSDVSKMRTLGNVMKWMMQDIIKAHPDMAQEYIDSLESVMWENYLTPKEADKIVGKMQPQPAWSKAEWERLMGNQGFVLESMPRYNKCALYVTMCMVCSDSGETIKKILGAPKMDDRVFDAIYNLALDKLEDEDKMFNIRQYFHMA